MNIVKRVCIIILLCAAILKATDSNNELWLRMASECDRLASSNYPLTIEDFLLTDEQGNNIYQIALNKHKETGSIMCAKMALMLESGEKKLREQLTKEHILSDEMAEKLDEVEKTFESPHK